MRAVVAADVERCDGIPIRLSGIAAKFKPHITLWGRFEPASDVDLDRLSEQLIEIAADLVLPEIDLRGPRPVGDMVWYEADPDCEGYEALRDVHNHLGCQLRAAGLIGANLLPEAFRGAGYRPHLTAAWGDGVAVASDAQMMRLRVRALSLYTYAHLPSDSLVTGHALGAVAGTDATPDDASRSWR